MTRAEDDVMTADIAGCDSERTNAGTDPPVSIEPVKDSLRKGRDEKVEAIKEVNDKENEDKPVTQPCS
jgi:hypothetical protein